jgi:hypothetical protein
VICRLGESTNLEGLMPVSLELGPSRRRTRDPLMFDLPKVIKLVYYVHLSIQVLISS